MIEYIKTNKYNVFNKKMTDFNILINLLIKLKYKKVMRGENEIETSREALLGGLNTVSGAVLSGMSRRFGKMFFLKLR